MITEDNNKSAITMTVNITSDEAYAVKEARKILDSHITIPDLKRNLDSLLEKLEDTFMGKHKSKMDMETYSTTSGDTVVLSEEVECSKDPSVAISQSKGFTTRPEPYDNKENPFWM